MRSMESKGRNRSIGSNKSKKNLGSNKSIGIMSKGMLFCLVIFLLALLSSCSSAVPDNMDRIGRPTNKTAPLEGTWKLKECLNDVNSTENPIVTEDPMLGEKIGFSQDIMAFAGNYFSNVSYKVKRVNVNEYFLHKDQEVLKNLSLKGNEILAITAYSDDKFLYEFIKDSEGLIIVNIDERYYCMEKVSDDFSGAGDIIADTLKRSDSNEGQKKNQLLQSGLLLSVRIPIKTDDGLGDYIYGTYWISGINRSLRPVLYAKDIYLPRMDGFWRLQIEKRLGAEGVVDILHASMVSKSGGNPPASFAENASKRLETKLRKAVVYVGNDYVCIENTVYDKQKDSTAVGLKKTLRTLPVDNLTNIDGIKISDLVGENGTMAMESAIAELLKESAANGIGSIDGETQEENFALFRKTGHWFFKGRLNLNAEEQLPYIDFNLNLIPPADMVAYDMLQVPWTEVKEKLPQALDIYTSPNKDLAVILTQNEMLLFAIENKMLSDEPLARLPLAEGSSVIMAEWATGKYVQSWEKSFIKNNETSLVENN